jgi:adenine-specific DNA-methyltransferase
MSEKIDGLSMDIAAAEQDKLRAVFPQCFTEGKLDERKLLELLGTFNTLDENDREKYEFRWKGKQEALQLAAKRSAGTLRPCPEESVDWDTTRNLYIEGDNLEVLKLLQTSYYRKVKMIYIDPPYNTGNDFVYADDFADPLARYREVTQQTTKSNPESMGRFHTNWLNMMLPRLRLAANLLRDDGVIFISIDDGEQANLRKICDEVFGEENFVANITWEKRYSPQNAVQWFSEAHDFIMVYAKFKEIWQPNLLERSDEMNARYRNLDNDYRGDWKPTDATAQGGHGTPSQFYELTAPNGKTFQPPAGRCWVYTQDRMQEMMDDNRVWFGSDGNSAPAIKRFLTEVKQGVACQTIWKYEDVGHNQEGKKEIKVLFPEAVPFDTPKPTRLIKRILQLCTQSHDTDIILDFFSGSATTAHAVMQLNAEDGGNRRFILVQIPEVCDEKSETAKVGYKNICEIGKERIRRAGAKIKDESPLTTSGLDAGFRIFKLDSSNLKQWDNSPVTGENAVEQFAQRMIGMIEFLKPDRSDTDVIYEVILKLGYDLCEPICAIDVGNGRQVYGVGVDIKFIVCLAENITVAEAVIMADYAPGRVVFADRCFNSSADKSNVKLTLRDRGITIRVL